MVVLVSRNLAKAAVWTTVACTLAERAQKSANVKLYYAAKHNLRMEKMQAEDIPTAKYDREKMLMQRKTPQLF